MLTRQQAGWAPELARTKCREVTFCNTAGDGSGRRAREQFVARPSAIPSVPYRINKRTPPDLPIYLMPLPYQQQHVNRTSDIPRVPYRINNSRSLELPIYHTFLTISKIARR